jgi:hypothetical protein
MDPRDVEASYRVAAAAPPMTPEQEAAIFALLFPVTRAA